MARRIDFHMMRVKAMSLRLGIVVALTPFGAGVLGEDNRAVIVDGITTNVAGVLVLGDRGTNNTLVVTHGGVLTSGSATVGAGLGSFGNWAWVTGPGSSWYCEGFLRVGEEASNNLVVITNGALVRSLGAVVGFSSTSGQSDRNRIVVAGSGSVWTNQGEVVVHSSSQESLTVRDGAVLDSDWIWVGGSAVASGVGTRLGCSHLRLEGGYAREARLEITDGAQVEVERTVKVDTGYGARPAVAQLSGRGSVLKVGSWTEVRRRGELILTNGGAVKSAGATVTGRAWIVGEGSVWSSPGPFVIVGAGPSAEIGWLGLFQGGALVVTNGTTNAVLELRDGRIELDGGSLQADQLLLTNYFTGSPARLTIRAGLLNVRTYVDVGSALGRESGLRIGDGSRAARCQLRGGPMRLASVPTAIIEPEGLLEGHGRITAHRTDSPSLPGYLQRTIELTNRGTLSVSAADGALRIAGNLHSSGQVRVEVGLGAAALQEPGLVVEERAVLGGSLVALLRDAVRLSWTNAFMVLRWGSRAGVFTNAPPGARLAVGPGSFRVHYTPEGLQLADYFSDLDGDGLDDLWATTCFGHTPLTEAERSADPDGDGLANAAEAIAGTDSHDAASVFRLVAVTPSAEGLRLRFTHVPGKWFRVWRSDMLGGWTEVAAPQFTVPVPGVAEWRDAPVPAEAPVAAPAMRFYRVSVE